MVTASSYFKRTEQAQLSITGDWILANYKELQSIQNSLNEALSATKTLDFAELTQMDTNGAYLLIKMVGEERLKVVLEQDASLPSAFRNLLLAVLQSFEESKQQQQSNKKHSAIALYFDHLGRRTIDAKTEAISWLAFFGSITENMLLTFFQPNKWRFTSVVAHVDSSGLQAVPIIFLLNFLVGAVIAFLGASVLEQFGATLFTVHLVGFAFMREFGVLLTAILIAGRTASAFTAHIGSMRLNEEVDALKVGGVEPLNMLVLPRVTALMISMPLLTFIAIIAGILGGMTVSNFMLGISPTLFMDVLIDKVGLRHFIVGLSKAPIFAVIIATTGCLEGFRVQGSAESLGRRTTSSVVKCIFLVILIDAMMAMFFMKMGW
ncbi:MAG: ABC transporter permease [Alcaligenaceae bacterium]|nr:ABC transporter permease [Alcaligenaceae bacterium]